MRAPRLLLLAVAFELVAPEPAYAYIDPSAGSLVIQVAAGVVFAGLLTVRKWWISAGDAAKLVWHSLRRQ